MLNHSKLEQNEKEKGKLNNAYNEAYEHFSRKQQNYKKAILAKITAMRLNNNRVSS